MFGLWSSDFILCHFDDACVSDDILMKKINSSHHWPRLIDAHFVSSHFGGLKGLTLQDRIYKTHIPACVPSYSPIESVMPSCQWGGSKKNNNDPFGVHVTRPVFLFIFISSLPWHWLKSESDWTSEELLAACPDMISLGFGRDYLLALLCFHVLISCKFTINIPHSLRFESLSLLTV